MKYTALFALLLLCSLSLRASFFEDSDAFFRKYVSDGKVDYEQLVKNSEHLDNLVSRIENTSLQVTPPVEKKAFYINAYNILVIKGVVDHYPIKSPLEVDGFFDKIKYNVAGEKLTLNEIENKKLREGFEDPRIHFALVCAAVSCPELLPEAYFPSELNRMLKRKSEATLNDPEFIRVNDEQKKVLVSEIFKWYKEDFGGTNNIISYINKYRDKEIPEEYSLDYYQYNWGLNEKK